MPSVQYALDPKAGWGAMNLFLYVPIGNFIVEEGVEQHVSVFVFARDDAFGFHFICSLFI